MRDKRGIGEIGFLPTWLVITIVIIVILLVFSFLSSFIKGTDDQRGADSILKEEAVGLGGVHLYLRDSYFSLAQIRFLKQTTTKSIEELFDEVKNG